MQNIDHTPEYVGTSKMKMRKREEKKGKKSFAFDQTVSNVSAVPSNADHNKMRDEGGAMTQELNKKLNLDIYQNTNSSKED